ncbi:MAG TPA: hypothetical protein VMG38_16030 [Trebonia sp.]|nr:hypothetical protein [Trebonia sp.]
MRKKLAAITGIVFALALGAPAAAQATAIPSGTGHVTVTQARPAAVNCGASDGLWDYGNQDYAVEDNNNDLVYFKPLSAIGAAPKFCNVSSRDVNGAFALEDSTTGLCIQAYDPGNGTEELAEAGCDLTGANADLWTVYATHGTYHSNTLYQFENIEYDVCMYDDLQAPAITASCGQTSDHFEWFVWSVGL